MSTDYYLAIFITLAFATPPDTKMAANAFHQFAHFTYEATVKKQSLLCRDTNGI